MRRFGAAAILVALASPANAADIPIRERATAALNVAGYPDFLAVDGDEVWVTNEGRVEKYRRDQSQPILSVAMPEPCGAMTVAFESLWVADCKEAVLYRVDRQNGRIAAVIPTGVADPQGELSVAAGAGSIWLLTDRKGVLSRIDPRKNTVVAQIKVAADSFAAVFGFDAVWITTTGASGSVQRIDPGTNTVAATIPVGPVPRFLAAGEDGVWTLNQGDGTVSRIDPRTNAVVATIATGVPGSGGDIDAGAGRVWVRATKVLLSEIDPATNRVVATYGPPAGSGAVRATGSAIWVTAHDINALWALPLPGQQKYSRTQVVLLGTGTPAPDPERSGPATAIVVDDTPYLVDFGPGVVRRASAAVAKGVSGLRLANLKVAFLTHLHADHTMGYADLIVTPWIAGRNTPLQVYGPRGLEDMTEHVLAAYRVDLDNRMQERGVKSKLVEAHEIQPGIVYRDEKVTVTAFAVPHGDLVAYGYRFQTPDRVIVISGDTSPTDAIVKACNGCDILLHEHYSVASFARSEPRWQDYRRRHHTSTRQLAELATRAHPGLLILYHRANPGGAGASAPESEVLQEMTEFYKGRWVSGHDLDVY